MSADPDTAKPSVRSALQVTAIVLQITVVAVGLVGQTVWIGQRLGALEGGETSNTRRLDVLEAQGSPALGAMRVTQTDDGRRIEQMQQIIDEQAKQIQSDRERLGVLDAQMKFLADSLKQRR